MDCMDPVLLELVQLLKKITHIYERLNITLSLFCYIPGGISAHWTNGSPLNPVGQEHMALWLTTVHKALIPQAPLHGSLHFCWMQARWLGHSAFIMHSGLHRGGLPVNPGKQVHTSWLFTTLHSAFVPHGDGTQGVLGRDVVAITSEYDSNN